MDNEELKRAGAAVQLWWMTQKHEPLSQEDGCDIARAVFDTRTTPTDGLREGLIEARGVFDELSRRLGPRWNWAAPLAAIAKIDAALATPAVPDEPTEAMIEQRPDGFVGMHFDECDYFISRGKKSCNMDCCS